MTRFPVRWWSLYCERFDLEAIALEGGARKGPPPEGNGPLPGSDLAQRADEDDGQERDADVEGHPRPVCDAASLAKVPVVA